MYCTKRCNNPTIHTANNRSCCFSTNLYRGNTAAYNNQVQQGLLRPPLQFHRGQPDAGNNFNLEMGG